MPDYDQTLVSLLYSSNATEPLDDAQLSELLAQSRESNARREVTGMLLYRGGRFIQVLEGPVDEVRSLAATIEADPRHTSMRVLIEEPIVRRVFGDWTMGFEPIAPLSAPVPDGFRSTFDDLERGDDASATARAARELSLWFRVRAKRAD